MRTSLQQLDFLNNNNNTRVMDVQTKKKKGAGLSSKLDDKLRGENNGVVGFYESVGTALKRHAPESPASRTHKDDGEPYKAVASPLHAQAPSVVQGHHDHADNIAYYRYMIAKSRMRRQSGMSRKERGQDLTLGAEEIRSQPTHDSGVGLTLGGKACLYSAEDGQVCRRNSPADASFEVYPDAGSTDLEKPGKLSDNLGTIDPREDSLGDGIWKPKEYISVWDWDDPGDAQSALPGTVASEDMPGAHYVAGNTTIRHAAAEEANQQNYENGPAVQNVADHQLVAAQLVDTEEEEQRIQELEAQNRMLRERERNVVEARVMKKSEILKSFFNLRDPEFRRQRLCAFGVIFLAIAGIVLGVIFGRPGPVGPPTEAPTMAPTPEPTSDGLGELTLFLSDFASFDGGASVRDQSTPQYQAAKWLANNDARLDEYSDKQKIQRYALATLYFSTGGDKWVDNTNWLDDGDECGRWWQSTGAVLSCTSQNDVSRIILGGNNLEGAIPPELAFLSSSLELVKLRENKLTGTVPTELALLTVLKSLDVDDNFLVGTLMTELGLLTKLDFLGMTENDFSGTIPDVLYLLTDLLTLRLGNNLTGPISTAIGVLTGLGELSLFENQIDGTIPSTIGLLTHLTELYLDSNELSGEIPSEIASIPSLEALYLRENKLAGTIPKGIYNMTTLRRLLLYKNRLSGTIPTSVGIMTALEKLHLDVNSNFTGPVPSELGTLTGLKELLLGANSFIGTIPSEVGHMIAMETFFLNENELTGTIPSEIGSMKNLIHLSLFRNMLNGTIPSSIHDLKKMKTLWLDGNDLEGPFTCPTDVADCKVSCEFDNETCRVL